MKRTGFTLAEILISLGIIGVIAALTLPALNNNAVEAQIGPKLAKAVSVLEQANTALLNDRGVDAFSDTDIVNWGLTAVDYKNALLNYLKGRLEPTGGQYGDTIVTKDGIQYMITYFSNIPLKEAAPGTPPHNVKVMDITIDINGINPPNRAGEDRFGFDMFNDGSLKPIGRSDGDADKRWTVKCKNGEVPENAWSCTASIFEQNLKVLYK